MRSTYYPEVKRGIEKERKGQHDVAGHLYREIVEEEESKTEEEEKEEKKENCCLDSQQKTCKSSYVNQVGKGNLQELVSTLCICRNVCLDCMI